MRDQGWRHHMVSTSDREEGSNSGHQCDLQSLSLRCSEGPLRHLSRKGTRVGPCRLHDDLFCCPALLMDFKQVPVG